ncbi:MAG: alkaline phosphatase family protein [Verrucomicrobiota bacterium]
MHWGTSLLLAAILFLPPRPLHARGQAEHVVVVVWDGLRPDFITPQYAPTLYELAQRGTFFARNHSAYITSTEVNGTALATGMHPEHSGVMANTGYRPDLNWLTSYGTESLDAVRRGDLLSQGRYLEAATLPEMLQAAGIATVIAGAKPVALLHDRHPNKTNAAQQASVTLFRGQTLPRAMLDTLTKSPDIGPLPTNMLLPPLGFPLPATSTNAASPRARGGGGFGTPNTPDSWTTKALTRGLWRKGVPKYSLLWLSEPDAAQHEHGLGSEQAIEALESSDKNLALVIKALEDKGVLEQTDIFVVSDHGFSTISRAPDIIDSLKKANFVAGRQFQNPESGDVMVVNLGGSLAFYVFNRDELVIRRLVAFLQTTDFAGVIFAGVSIPGTFPLSQVCLSTNSSTPDVVVSMRWTPEPNEFGVAGMIASVDGKKGRGTHASLSPFDTHNTLVAAGPDFRAGFVSELASGNIDVVPTVLFLLGVEPPTRLDGRVLVEALSGAASKAPLPHEQTLEAARAQGFLTWRQYLKVTRVGTALYFDEGNGASRMKIGQPSELRPAVTTTSAVSSPTATEAGQF